MYLTREALDAWADSLRNVGNVVTGSIGSHLIRLEEGDSMPRREDSNPGTMITGPALVELVVYRDGGWSARELAYETVESIALAASLAQRQATIRSTEISGAYTALAEWAKRGPV